jgi:hypothetical protein
VPPSPGSAGGQSPRFGLGSRFGPSTIDWEIGPVSPVYVRFDLDGLGDPFHRLLGRDLNVHFADRKAVIQAIETGGDDVAQLIDRLDTAWDAYNLRGAVLIYTWRDELKQVISARIVPPKPAKNPFDSGSDDEPDIDPAEPVKEAVKAPVCLRAIDFLLVLNVLGRTRSQILMANAPLVLQGAFLERSLITDDPRLIAIARATGCIEEYYTR